MSGSVDRAVNALRCTILRSVSNNYFIRYRNYKTTIRSLYVAGLLAITFSPLLHCQVGELSNITSTPILGVGHDYVTDLDEMVNPANGAVSIRIAAPTPNERGYKNPLYAYLYDTNGQFFLNFSSQANKVDSGTSPGYIQNIYGPVVTLVPPFNPGTGGYVYGGTSYQKISFTYHPNPLASGASGPSEVCNAYSNFIYTDVSGGRHPLGVTYEIPNTGSQCSSLGVNTSTAGGDNSYKIDTTYYGPPQDKTTPNTITIDLHGNRAGFEDTNGNLLNTTGRPWNITYNSVFQPSSMTVPDLQTPYVYEYERLTPIVGQQANYLNPVLRLNSTSYASTCQIGSAIPGYEPTVVKSITLPNNQQYTFTYDSIYGLIQTITYPTGATVTYTWKNNAQSNVVGYKGNYTVGVPIDVNPNPICVYTHDMPAVDTRITSFDGVNPAEEQTFSYSTTWSPDKTAWLTKTTTVTTKDLLRPGQPSFATIYSYLPLKATANLNGASTTYPNPLIPVEDTIVSKDYSGTTLRTRKKLWNNINQLAAECTTLPTGQTSGLFYKYAQYQWGSINSVAYFTSQANQTNLLTDVAQFDYGAVASSCEQPTTKPLKESTTTYANLGSPAYWPHAPAMQDRPQTLQTFGNGTLLAESDYSYDEFPLAALTAVPYGHDELNYGYSAITAYSRGNTTTNINKCFIGTIVCPNSSTTVTYDATGQPATVTDSNNNKTTLSFADNFSADSGSPPGSTNAYLTAITRPTTLGVVHSESFMYDYAKGLLRTATDENGRNTSYRYDDPWSRPTEIDYPDTGKQTTIYNDEAPSPTIKQTTYLTTSGGTKTNTITKDGIGHTVHSSLTSSPSATNPSGTITTDIAYDGLGEEYQVWNPYRSTTDSTYGITTYTYDALGHKVYEAKPDGNIVSWCYEGVPFDSHSTCFPNVSTQSNHAWVDYTDELGQHSQRVSDSLDKVVAVVEPDASTNILKLETDYGYDALGNLIVVTQNGSTGDVPRIRKFSYDSLSHLITLSTPEGGLVCNGLLSQSGCVSGYDGNGNLTVKTDARNIQSNYIFDKLNRLTQKSYSDGTPTVNYLYDALPDTVTANTIGRSTGQTVSQNQNTLFQTVIPAYDSMGRVMIEKRCFVTNCSALGAQVNYTYDLVGNELSASPSYFVDTQGNPYVFNYTYDSLGRFASEYVSATDQILPTFIKIQSLTPANGLEEASVGWGMAAETRAYDNRNRLLSISDGIPASSPTYSSSYTYTPLGSQLSNGNIYRSIDSVNGDISYSYDSLNRLIGAASTSSGMSTYGYDSFSNRTAQDGVRTYHARVSSSNQVLSEGMGDQADCTNCYDASGNMIWDVPGTPTRYHYTYDAENRLNGITELGITYLYDGDNDRIAATQNGNVIKSYIHEANNQFYFMLGTGSSAAEFFGGGRHVATLNLDSAEITFPYLDLQGTERVRVDSSGTVQETCMNLPYGDGQTCSQPEQSSLHFTGKERDTEGNQFDNFGARYYSSGMGRFVSPDPTVLNIRRVFNPQRWNMYSYALNSPLGNVDPDGNEVIPIAYPNYQDAYYKKHTIGLGHGGVVLVEKSGSTHYFEYGRYDGPDGIMQEKPTPNVQRDSSGQITQDSMNDLLHTLSENSGKGGVTDALVIPTTSAEDENILAYLKARKAENQDPNRRKYRLLGGHNCGTLACETLNHANMTSIRPLAFPGLPYNNFMRIFAQFQNDSAFQYKPREHVTVRIFFNEQLYH